jgi:GT2 family glycosyltransferase
VTIAVFLNFRTPYHTLAAVRSLEATNSPVPVIIVDNASNDGSTDLFTKELPSARLIAADANRGFSAGCNLGVQAAMELGAERVLLLNSDVVVTSGMVSVLEQALGQDARVGIVAPMVVGQQNPDVVQSLGIDYHRLSGRMRHRGYGHRRLDVPTFDRRIVDGVSGCAMMVRRDVFEAVGLLAEEYYFGYEDLDFALRAREAGYLTACVGSAVILHEGSVSIGRQSPLRIYFATRNHLLLGSRFPPRQPLLRRGAKMSTIAALNLAYTIFTGDVPRVGALRAFCLGVRDHVGGRYGGPPATLIKDDTMAPVPER